MMTFRQSLFTVAAGLLLAAFVTTPIAGTAHAQPNKCLAGKTKCVNKKIAGLLKCQEKCQKNPDKCGAVQDACEAKVIAKFDGGTKGVEKSCFGKLEAKDDGVTPERICSTTGDLVDMEAKADAFVARVVGSLDPAERFERRVTPTGETVIDYLTGLEWETKGGPVGSPINCSDDPSFCDAPQNVNYRYTWSSTGGKPDGRIFLPFLGQLNGHVSTLSGTDCFAGHCDWRIPTSEELETIVDCSFGNPCIDPIFGATASEGYWSSSSDASDPARAWLGDFIWGGVFSRGKGTNYFVRAVRGSL